MVDLLVPLAAIFVVASVFLIVGNRLSIPAVPVYILVGLAVGPFLGEGTTIELAQWGIAFLVFAFGVDVDVRRFRTVAEESQHVAAAQVLFVGCLAAGIGLAFGLAVLDATYFGIAAALSSSLVGRELAISEIRRNLVSGRLVSSIHFVQDLFAVAFILVLGASTFTLDGVALKLGYGVMLLAVAVLVRVYLFDVLVRLAGDSDELTILTGLALLVGFVSLAELVEVSVVVGAFAAGLAIAREFPNNLALLSGIESFEDFFATIFFVTVGSLVAVPSRRGALLAIPLFLTILLVKPLVTTLLLVYEGYGHRTAATTSLGLDQVSEFSLIVAIQALVLGRIDPSVFEAIILVAATTMITSTLTRQYEERIFHAVSTLLPSRVVYRQIDERSAVDQSVDSHVIVVGYGQLGRLICAVCDRVGQPVVVIENDPDALQELSRERDQYVFGDAMSEIAWDRARLERARLIVSTVPHRRLSERILELDANADRFVRASNNAEAAALFETGADYVIVPDFLASERLLEKIDGALSRDVSREEFKRRNRQILPTDPEFRDR